uniref:Uncharacterized protein n=1 Tax=Oryza meridionalis TaxID=40149 RepID=A0A0E0CIN9_9ORYZ
MDTCDAKGYSSSSSAAARRLQSLYSLFGGKYTATVQIAQGAAGSGDCADCLGSSVLEKGDEDCDAF